MSTREKLINARLSMLALAEQLKNISLACQRAGISRSHYDEIKQAFEKFGPEGLAPAPRRRPRMPNQTPPELELQILEMTERYPSYSYVRLSAQQRLVGVGTSASACATSGDIIASPQNPALWLEQKTAARGGVLTESQLRLLQKYRSTLSRPGPVSCSRRTPTSERFGKQAQRAAGAITIACRQASLAWLQR